MTSQLRQNLFKIFASVGLSKNNLKLYWWLINPDVLTFSPWHGNATDNTEIQRIIRDYYEQLYGNKIDNLKEMDRLLEKFNLPRLNQEEIEIMNHPITSTKIEAVIKNLP